MSILRTIHKATQDLRNRIMLMLSRGVLYRLDDDEGLQIAQVGLLANEIRDNIERFQDYGFTSVPQEGADVVAGFFGGNRDHGVLLRVDDRRCRLAGLENGEVAIYTDEGDTVILKRNNTIEVTTKRLIIKAEDEVDVETKKFNVETQKFAVNASESITMSAPRTSQNTDSLTMAGLERDGPCEATFKADMRLLGDMLQQGDHQQMGSQLLSGSLGVGGRILGNPVLGAVEGGGGSAAAEAQAELENNIKSLSELLESQAKNELLLCTPDIAEAMAGRAGDADNARGWLHLSNMLRRWLNGPANNNPDANPEPYWVEWDWVMSYPRARRAYEEFTRKVKDQGPNMPETEISRNIYNEAARKQLGEILRRNGRLGYAREQFDYIGAQSRQEWQNWKDRYHTLRAVGAEGAAIDLPPNADGLMAAMAGFTLRALSKGYTEPDGMGGHRITVEACSVFIHDVFNFEGDDDLYYWLCKDKQFSFFTGKPEDNVYNKDFQKYRSLYGKGNDFLVLSAPHRVDNFDIISYTYL